MLIAIVTIQTRTHLLLCFHFVERNETTFLIRFSVGHLICGSDRILNSIMACVLCPTGAYARIHFQYAFHVIVVFLSHSILIDIASCQSSIVTSYCTRCIFHLLHGKSSGNIPPPVDTVEYLPRNQQLVFAESICMSQANALSVRNNMNFGFENARNVCDRQA